MVLDSSAKMTFLGKMKRQSVTISNVPVLIALSKKGFKDEEDITLGINGIFDTFEINFKKHQNRITLKEVGKSFAKQLFK